MSGQPATRSLHSFMSGDGCVAHVCCDGCYACFDAYVEGEVAADLAHDLAVAWHRRHVRLGHGSCLVQSGLSP